MKTAFDPEFGPGGNAIGPDAILDRYTAVFVPAQRRVHQPMVVTHVAMDDGEVFFLDGMGFPEFAERAGDRGTFSDEHDTAGFPVETVDEARRCRTG